MPRSQYEKSVANCLHALLSYSSEKQQEERCLGTGIAVIYVYLVSKQDRLCCFKLHSVSRSIFSVSCLENYVILLENLLETLGSPAEPELGVCVQELLDMHSFLTALTLIRSDSQCG